MSVLDAKGQEAASAKATPRGFLSGSRGTPRAFLSGSRATPRASAGFAALFALLATDGDGRWHPGIGDPTVIGWLTVLGYFVAAFLCFRAMRLAQACSVSLPSTLANEAANERSLSRLWGLSALIMVGLGINKQLDLQTWFTEILRDLSRDQGWYDNRRVYQVLFIAAIALVSMVLAGLLAYSLRRVLVRARGTVLGLAMICCFVVIRAASMHHVDALLGLRFGHLKVNALLELSGILVVALSARRGLRWYLGPRDA